MLCTQLVKEKFDAELSFVYRPMAVLYHKNNS